VTKAEESLAPLLARPSAGAPEFFLAQREAGAEAFRKLGLPTTRQEDWRYTSLAELAKLTLRRAGPAPAPAAELPPAPRLVFVNGRYDFGLSDLAGLPDGAVVHGLADALARAPQLVEPWLGRRAPIGAHPFAALAAALADDGAFVVLPAGVRAARTIHVVHLAAEAEGAAIAARGVVVAGPGAQARVAEHWVGAGGPYLVAATTEVFLAEGADVEVVRVEREGDGAFHVGLLEVEQAARSRFRGASFLLGGRLARLEARALLSGPGAEAVLEGASLADGTRLHDHLVLVDHASPSCASRQVFKNVLDDRAHGVFAGQILVRRDAQQTDGSQVSSTLLLSPDAVIDTKPQLQIDADDVKCSHGGTVGQLDENALFYLRSRGVEPRTARALLTWAFASEIVEGIGDAALRADVRRLVAGRLGADPALAAVEMHA
jgi:Fe-S cluster assembly protein SufD